MIRRSDRPIARWHMALQLMMGHNIAVLVLLLLMGGVLLLLLVMMMVASFPTQWWRWWQMLICARHTADVRRCGCGRGCSRNRHIVVCKEQTLLLALLQLQLAGSRLVDGTRLAQLAVVLVRYVHAIDTHTIDMLPGTV